MALYQDPAKPRLRPSLVKDLFTIPAKATNHQIENQATAVLAWLIDRSPALAAAIVELFLGDAAPRVTHAGTRTWVSLPKPGGGAVFPDLSIDGDGASLQLLIEVKVGSDFHDYVTPEGTVVSQPEFYRRVWSRLPTWGEARQRAVGTLTRHGGPMPVELAALRARDVTWSQVRDRLRALLEAGELATDVALVAASFLEAIDAQIAVEAPDPSHLKAWLAQHRPVVDAIGDELTSLLPGASAASSSGGQFVARRVTIPEVLGRALVLRVYASPAGSGLTLPGWPDGVIVGVERDANGTLEAEAALRFAEVGFLRRRDIDGFWLHRELWPMEQARQDPAATAAQVVELVAATGLVSLR